MATIGKSQPSVEYNWLGPNAGLKVSNICYGAASFGPHGIYSLPGNTDEAESHAILDRFVELGGNFIDTANVYSNGESEEILGSWLSKRDRSSVVVSTKVGFSDGVSGVNGAGLGRTAIFMNIEKSLKRLQTDYIDIYYSHAWDAGVKIEETLRTFNDLVRCGKVRYAGISNVTGVQLQKIVDYNKFMGFDRSVVLQPEYSLMERSIELDIIPAVIEEELGIVSYSALKGGLLTGKFKREDKDIAKNLAGTRLAWTAEKPLERTWNFAPYVEEYRENDEYWKLMELLGAVAKTHGKTVPQVAIRWVLQRVPVSSVIIGAKTIKQLEDDMGAGTGWRLSDDEMTQLTEASSFAYITPSYPYNFLERMNADRKRSKTIVL